MSRSLFLAVLCFALFSFTAAIINEHLVTSVPGYAGKPPSRHFSGLLASDDASTVFLHYWFVESTNNPATDPVMVWMNGGPGCSSLEGFLYEQGPLHFTGNRSTTGLPSLVDNPYAWTNVASVIFLESPAGVGFSYAKNGSTRTNDEITSQNNYGFLKTWYKGYSEYAKNPLFITGESYAGIYVPTLVGRIADGAKSGDNTFPLQGFAIGNACWGNAVGTCAMYGEMAATPYEGVKDELNFLHGHAMISEPHWEAVVKNCGNFTTETNACDNAIGEAENDGGDYNIYNIYDTCPNTVSPNGSPILRAPNALRSWAKAHKYRTPKSPQTPDTCYPSSLGEDWLDNKDVQTALHVTDANQTEWSVCAGVGYEKTVKSLLGNYPALIAQYRVLVYSGETDACVPHTGSEAWVRGLGYPVKEEWRPWLVNQQVAGYVTEYTAAHQFTFLTVKGAGHMVPQYQPEAALAMITRWAQGKPF